MARGVTTGSDSGGNDAPLYAQVARTLREEIVNGSFPTGTQLPTEEELRARFQVSRFTVREALRRLREDGLVVSRQGAGTLVVPGAPDRRIYHSGSVSDLLAWAEDARFEIESSGMIVIDEETASRTGAPAGETWLEVRGLRLNQETGAPISWVEYYIAREFSAVARLLPRYQGPIFPMIEDLFGVAIGKVENVVSAILVPAVLAAKLDVDKHSAALEVLRTYWTTDDQIAQVTINTHPASRFRQSMTMRRATG